MILDDLRTIERILFSNLTTQSILSKDGWCEDSEDESPERDDSSTPSLLVSLRQYLEKLDRKVQEICSHQAFRHKKARQKFLKSISELLKVIESNNEMWGSYESTIAETELERATDTSSMPRDISERSYKLRWNSYCRSKAFRISKDMIARSEREGTEIPARVHCLPNSIFTILEHWRRDGNVLVGAIRQVGWI